MGRNPGFPIDLLCDQVGVTFQASVFYLFHRVVLGSFPNSLVAAAALSLPSRQSRSHCVVRLSLDPSKAGVIPLLVFCLLSYLTHYLGKRTGREQNINTIYIIYTMVATMIFKNLLKNSGSSDFPLLHSLIHQYIVWG